MPSAQRVTWAPPRRWLRLLLGIAVAMAVSGFAAPCALAKGSPHVSFSWAPQLPRSGAPVSFFSGAVDPDGGTIKKYEWDFDSDGTVDATVANPTYSGFTGSGDRLVTLVVTDDQNEQTTEVHLLHVHDGNLAPVATNLASAPLAPRAGSAATFSCTCSDADSSAPLTYDWNWNDGTPHGTTESPTHTFATAGNHVVRLTLRDADGGSTSETMAVQVHSSNAPPLVVVAAGTRQVALGESIELGVNASDDSTPAADLVYSWDFGDATGPSATPRPAHAWSKAGDYIVRVTVTDGDGDSAVATVLVRVERPAGAPNPSFSTPFDISSSLFYQLVGASPLTGQAVSFSDGSTDPDGTIAGRSWDFGDGSTSTATSPVHTFSTPGDKVVVLTVTDNSGNVSRFSRVMHVHAANLPAAVAIGASVDSAQAGRAVSLSSYVTDPDNPGAPGTSYSWDFGDGSSPSTDPAPVHTFGAAGDYEVLLQVTDAGGDVTSAAMTLHVHDGNLPPEAHFSSDPSYPGTGVAVTFFDNSVDRDGQVVSQSWDFGDGTTGAGPGATHTYAVGGDYRVRETVIDDDGTASYDVETVHVGSVPPSNEVAPSITGTPQRTATLTVHSGTWSGTAPITYEYQWRSCDAQGNGCTDIPGAVTTTTDATATFVAGHSQVGHVVTARVTASNIAGRVAVTAAGTPVVAGAPPDLITAPSVPAAPRDGQVLTADPGLWDSGSGVGYAYQWQRCDAGANCQDIAGATDGSYRATWADETETLRVHVVITDDEGTAQSDSAPSAPVAPGPPVKLTDPSLSGTWRDGLTVTAADGTYDGSPATSTRYQWQRCDALGGSCGDIAGATAGSYGLVPADVGQRLRVTVVKHNDQGEDSGTSATGPVVSPTKPVAQGAPIVTGTPVDSSTLSSDQGTFAGTPALAYTYQWRRCDVTGLVCTPVSGATTVSYTAGAADVGSRLVVRVTAVNPAGTDYADSAPTAPVAALAPTTSRAPALQGSAQDGQLLSVSPGAYGGTAPAVTRHWQRCDAPVADDGGALGCIDIPSATATSYRLTAADIGHRVTVVEDAMNPAGHVAAGALPSAVVVGAPPAVVSAPVVQGVTRAGSPLTAAGGSFSGTGPLGYTDRWRRCDQTGANCVVITGATGSSYTPVSADVGHTLRFDRTATNGVGTATSTSPATAIVAAAPPDAGRVRTALAAALAPTRGALTFRSVLRAKGYATAFANAFGRGVVTLEWYTRSRPVLVARAVKTVSTSGRVTMKIALTSKGAALIRRSRRTLGLNGRGTFAPAGSGRISVTRAFSVRRR